jgi:acetolactate synthase regulatory subunit
MLLTGRDLKGARPMTLELEIRDTPDVLLRALTVLRRRGCAITSVDYLAGDRHRSAHLTIGVDAPSSRARSIPAWLENLVDVMRCETDY